jgi:hypothetical protein
MKIFAWSRWTMAVAGPDCYRFWGDRSSDNKGLVYDFRETSS